jgi:eukaryotic-like serine/threonine-protein kinase
MLMQHPSRIGKYEVEEYLGGGMSRVYRAKDSVLGRLVALKVLAESGASDPEAKARFLQEARLASSIAHENIIAVYDFGEEEGRPFMVMEFLEGESLRDAIAKRRTGDFARRLQIALQVGRAIGHIHLKKIIHRDIKPENIHLDPLGRAKLMDFGIAKPEGMRLANTGFTVGTPYYMSPEQVLGQDVTNQADVYSFGVLLYELLADKKPIEAESSEKIFHKILYDPLNLEPLHEAAVAPAAIDLVRKCMAKPPAERPQGFGIICGAIEETLRQGALQPRPAPAEPEVKPPARDELPRLLRALPGPLRTQGGLALLAGGATLLVMAAIYFGLRLANVI